MLLYADEQQRKVFEAAKVRAQALFDAQVVTEIKPLETFWEAEDYHQDYYALNPYQGYCSVVISPKVAAARRKYAHLLK